MIRPAELRDADELGRLHTQGWTQGYRGLLPDHYLDSLTEEPARARWARKLAKLQQMDVLVAVDDDDRVLGFTSIGTCFDDDRRPGGLEIWDLWVDRDQRSRGIGASLIAAAHELATGERDITVWVLAANLRGLEFYRRTGAQWDNRVRTTTKPDGVVITDVRLRWPRGVVATGSGRQG